MLVDKFRRFLNAFPENNGEVSRELREVRHIVHYTRNRTSLRVAAIRTTRM